MFKKRRFKPVNKKMVSLSLAVIMLMSVPGKSVLSYAMTGQEQNAQKQNVQEQSVESESGYRLYADELTSDSGAVKGDITEVLPEYEIINVKLPDGSLAAPEEVNFPVTESGEYVFEVIYDSVPDDNGATEITEEQAVEGQNISDGSLDPAGNGQLKESTEPKEMTDEENSVETEDVMVETKETSKSETLTLAVTLPDAEDKADSASEETESQNVESRSEKSMMKSAPFAVQASSGGVSARSWGDYDWANSNKTWSRSDFLTYYAYASNKDMNYGNNPSDAREIKLGIQDDSNRGVKFTFGQKEGTSTGDAYWLQQGLAFSNIAFDFSKDFALQGSMRIGNSFGAPSDSPDDEDLKIDGGVTIAFVPQNQTSKVLENSKKAYGAAYRLGAYGTLPNSIVLEFDTSTDVYYETTPYYGKNFVIDAKEIQKTGDYNYSTASGNAWPSLNGKNIAESAIAKKDGGQGIQNLTHIGVSTTGSDAYVSSKGQTSERVTVGSSNTGVIPYEINYDADTEVITFTVTETDSDRRTVSYDLTNFFLSDGSSSKNKMKLAFTYGAAYFDLNAFMSNGAYFTGNNSTGQIDIWAKQLYVTPDLQVGDRKVRWLDSGTSTPADSSNNNAYYNGSSYNYSNRALWPVAGDRVFAQFKFIPATSIMPQPGATNPGTLKLRVADLSIKNISGNTNIGKSISANNIYYKPANKSNWTKYDPNSPISVTGTEDIYIRVEMKLPELEVNSAVAGYYVTGNVYGDYQVGNSKVTYKIPLMAGNNDQIKVSTNPRFVRWNGLNYNEQVRIIKTTDNLSALTNTAPNGNQDSGGNKASIHYGAGYRLGSSDSPAGLNGGATGVTFTYQSAEVSDLTQITKNDKVENNASIPLTEDTRYVLSYELTDTSYSSKAESLTGNSGRGTSSGKRVIWNSDNVEISNGYEFYSKPSVTMSQEDFKGFLEAQNKATYYNKIAEAVGAIIFKTSDYNFANKVNSTYSNVTGTGDHTAVETALNNPGTPADVTLRFTENNVTVDRTIQLTLTEGVKPVTLENDATDNDAANSDYTKVLVKTGTNHTFNVTATFKYDDTAENFEKIKGEDKLFVALYQQDSSNGGNDDGTGNFTFLKGSANMTAPAPPVAATLVSEPEISELDNTNKTFTVTFAVRDDTNLTTANGYSSYNHKDYQIIAWTSANQADSFTGDGVASESFGDTTDHAKVPQVRSKIYVQKPIAVTNGYATQTVKFYENTGSFTTSFDYDARSEFTGNNTTVNYAIYRVQGGNNQLGICETGTISLTDGSVSRITGNQVFGTIGTIKANLKDSESKIELTIELNSNEGRTRSTYRVYVWNESNGTIDLLQSDGRISMTYRESDPLQNTYPLSETKVLKIPKVYTNGTAAISQTVTNKMFYDGDPLTISATFTLEGGKTSDNTGDRKETISNLLTDPENSGELKIALYKKNPDGKGEQRYQMFALAKSDGSGLLSTTYKANAIGDAVITASGDTGFTVTFTKTNGDYEWDDGASYYIYAWTGANAKDNELPGNFGTGAENTVVADNDIVTANGLIPSVKTSMLGILTQEHFDEIIHYPKEIAMMDNVKPSNNHIFSANQKITMTPLKVQEGSQTVAAEVPDPDSGVDVVIKEISDNQDVENSIQVSRTVGNGNETIKLTCFLGTIESDTAPKIGTNGKVGTLYFEASKNELPLYFRSSTPPNVADGAPFTGQIHFIFSKSGSGN